MDIVTKEIALKFCEACNWTYECWVTHKTMFDNNERKKQTIERYGYFFRRLFNISLEYSLLQISKLHDPADQGGRKNLTIEYMVRLGDWGQDRSRIQELKSKLDELWMHLRVARNKVCAHLDLKVILANTRVGAFPKGMDDHYFEVLQMFVNEVHSKWIGKKYVFNDLAEADAEEVLDMLARLPSREEGDARVGWADISV